MVWDIEEEYKKNSKLSRTDIQNLREWINKQPHLPYLPDEELAMFLHSCSYQTEAAKLKIDLNYTIRTQAPQLFSNRDPKEKMKDGLNIMYMAPIPPKTKEGCLVLWCKLVFSNTDIFVMEEIVKAFYVIIDVLTYQERTLPGIIIVYDMEGASLSHLLKCPLARLKEAILYMQEALPVQIQAIHILNPVSFMDKAMSILRPFIQTQSAILTHTHHEVQSLQQYIPKDLWPEEYDGGQPSLQRLQMSLLNMLEQHRDWIKKKEKCQVNEAKRPPESKANALFGADGSFKKLDID